MEPRQLRHFLDVVDCLHFGRAAERAHVSPSALSRSIHRLEDELGVRLFERDNRNVALTRAGRRFADYARTSLDAWRCVRDELASETGEIRGGLSLYCSVTASYSFLADILETVRRDHPHIEIGLHTGDPEKGIRRVLAGEDDIAIALRPDRMPARLAFSQLDTLPLVFIVAHDHPAISGLSKNAWANAPLIVNEHGVVRERVDQWFRSNGRRPNIHAQVAGNEAIVGMTALGFGIGVVPRLVLESSPLAGKVYEVPVEPALEPCEVGLVALEKRLSTPVVGAFWKSVEGQRGSG